MCFALIAAATSPGTTSISAAKAPASSSAFTWRQISIALRRRLADGAKPACPGGLRRDEADVAADRDALIAHAANGRKACRAVDRVASRFERLECGADIFVGRDQIAIFEARERRNRSGPLRETPAQAAPAARRPDRCRRLRRLPPHRAFRPAACVNCLLPFIERRSATVGRRCSASVISGYRLLL